MQKLRNWKKGQISQHCICWEIRNSTIAYILVYVTQHAMLILLIKGVM